MWAAQSAPERGVSPMFIIGLLLLLFFMSADMSSWGASNSTGAQQVRLGQPDGHARAQEVRDKLLYELSVSNERLEKENRQLHQKLLVLRGLLRACRGNMTAGSTSELAQMAQAELALATGDAAQTSSRSGQNNEGSAIK